VVDDLLFFCSVPTLFKYDSSLFLDKIAHLIQLGEKHVFVYSCLAGKVQIPREAGHGEVGLAKAVATLERNRDLSTVTIAG
jgi:hypothetical protein